jgi:trk system potassium uptake protein TrkA
MNVIVVGCGKVGYALADTLCGENHNVTVIDSSDEKVERISNNLDVAGIKGNGASYRVLQEAGVEDCDVLIACTNQDEVNMLCCLIARKAGRCRTIARVRDPNYYSEIGFIKEELGLSLAINPELAAASACYQLLRTPYAMELDAFAKGQVEMITFDLPENSPWLNKPLSEITRSSRFSFLATIVWRNHEALIPNGNTVLKKGDRVSVMLATHYASRTLEMAGIRYKPVRSVMIAAGGNVGYYLARKLCEDHIDVTIIEPIRKRCDELTDLLPKANIIYGDACNEKLLLEEHIDEMDAFVALTGNDSENIMMGLFANRYCPGKLITRMNKVSMGEVLSDLPLGAVVSPKELTAEKILSYVRAIDNRDPTNTMDAVYRLAGDRVEALAFTVNAPSPVTGRRLAELPIRSDILVCAIIRRNSVTIPSGQDAIQTGDQVVLVTNRRGLHSLNDILK